MKIKILYPHALNSAFEIIPRYSYTSVLHFEVKGDWLYYTVSGWAFGLRDRLSIENIDNWEGEFSLVIDDVLYDLRNINDGAIEWDINPSMKYVYTLVKGVPRTYSMVHVAQGKFYPTGGEKYYIDISLLEKALSSDPVEMITVTGGQAYVNNPMSPTAPIYRVNEHFEVENFSTSSLLLRAAPYIPYETPMTLTPTHAMLRDEATDTYVFTERYMENPHYMSKSLLYGLLLDSQTEGGVIAPDGLLHALYERAGGAGPVRVNVSDGTFSVVGYREGFVLYEDANYPDGSAVFDVNVDIDALIRALLVCEDIEVRLALSAVGGRTALLVRSAQGAALLPTEEKV